MTPAARVQAAIEILDAMAEGQAAEQALTRWARRSRFAGSKDRAAVRDHVFDVLRRRRLAAHQGGGESGRALMIGILRARGDDPGRFFSGDGHAPPPLSAEEQAFDMAPPDLGAQWNLPDWLLAEFQSSLGDEAARTAQLLQERAPVCLRVNRRRGSVADAARALSAEGVETVEVPEAPWALRVTEGARRLRNSRAFLEGRVELQDAHSQRVALDLPAAASVLDYCAGGGGKALAIADASQGEVFAHDADPGRMKDLGARADRAGVAIRQLATEALADKAPYDIVLCDAPCSGSGSWRRTPEMKWALTAQRLDGLISTQQEIVRQAAGLVRPGGILAYATCSVLSVENETQVSTFLSENPGWVCLRQMRYPVTEAADGFFCAHFTR